MAALTNVVGFGSLTFSNYPALRSVGIISSVGSVACLLTALTLLPAILALRGARLAHGTTQEAGAAASVQVGSGVR
jgi:predicted RND superfamily exporter protein